MRVSFTDNISVIDVTKDVHNIIHIRLESVDNGGLDIRLYPSEATELNMKIGEILLELKKS